MEQDKNFIGRFALLALTVNLIVGSNAIRISGNVAKFVGNEGIIVIIIGAIITYILLVIYNYLFKLYDYKLIDEICIEGLGEFIGRITIFIFLALIIFALGGYIADFNIYMRETLLPKTPSELSTLLFILIASYVVIGGVRTIVGFSEVMVWLIIVPIILQLIIALAKGDFTRVLPLFNQDFKAYAQGSLATIQSIIGVAFVIAFLPYVKNKKKINKTLAWGVGIGTIALCAIFIATIVIAGVSLTQHTNYATLTVIESIELRSSFFDRWGAVFNLFYSLMFFTSLVGMIYLSTKLLDRLCGFENSYISGAVLSPFIYIIVMLNSKGILVRIDNTKIRMIGAYIAMAIPLVVLVVTLIKRQLRRKQV